MQIGILGTGVVGQTIATALVSKGNALMIGTRDPAKGLPGNKGPTAKLFTYLRYNAELSAEGLTSLGVGHLNPEHVQQMDSIEHIGEMQEVGRAVAKKVTMAHFEGFLS